MAFALDPARPIPKAVRKAAEKQLYSRENRALRDAARLLSPVRDAWVLVEALDDLVTPADDTLSAESVAGFRAVLAGEHRELQTGLEEKAPPSRRRRRTKRSSAGCRVGR